jgi:antitoxin component of MazEF toxin-antitoxin module
MTIPIQMQRELEMVKGDELEFVIENGRITNVHVLKPVRVDLLPSEVLESIKRRKASGGAQRKLSAQELKRLVEGEEAEVAARARAVVRG